MATIRKPYRHGNSIVMSLPKDDLALLGYEPGDRVVVREGDDHLEIHTVPDDVDVEDLAGGGA